MREATVAQFMRRYHVDPEQAARVGALAVGIYDALAVSRREDAPREDDPDRTLLGWSATG